MKHIFVSAIAIAAIAALVLAGGCGRTPSSNDAGNSGDSAGIAGQDSASAVPDTTALSAIATDSADATDSAAENDSAANTADGTDAKNDDTTDAPDTDDKTDSTRAIPTLVIETPTRTFCAALKDNPSAKEFNEKLSPLALGVDLADENGTAKVGVFPWTLTVSGEKTTAAPGDIVLCDGDKLAICFGEDERTCTPVASIENTSPDELLAALGEDDAFVTLWIEWSE